MSRDPDGPPPPHDPLQPAPDAASPGRAPQGPAPPSDPLAPDPDATLPMPPPGPEAIEAGALSSDADDEAVEPAAVVPKSERSSTAASAMVAAGILLSRVA